MCGIAGYVSKQKPKKKILKQMTDRIAHRGPDAEGFYLDNKCALGHRRLAIIDLNSGNQPIYNENKNIVVVFNGEIYNYLELKAELEKEGHIFTTNSDTEVLVHGYEMWQDELPAKLRGMFAYAIWDKTKQKLVLARDGFGIKPLYFYHHDNTFMFASEIKAFLDHPDFHKEFNEEILAAYLCFNSCPSKETFFKNVYRLMPGYQLIYENNQIHEKQFFKLDFAIQNDKSLDELVNSISSAMENSAKYHQIADVEVGSFLSSGIDSSYLVSMVKPNKTYTVGYDNPKYDEIGEAQKLASALNITNKSMKITKKEYIKAFPDIMYYMDEPLADPSAIALYFLAKLASQDVKVVMSGEGADELFGGYNSYQEEVTQQWYMRLPYFIRHAISQMVSLFPDHRGLNFLYRRGQKLENYNIGLGRIMRDKEALDLVNNKKQILTKEIVKTYYAEYQEETNLVKRQVIDYYFWLVNDFLHAVDRNTMMFGLEARTPYLDKEVYNVARTLPDWAKVDKNTTKLALRLAAKKTIPTEAYKKRKLGFPVPLREWMKEDDLYHKIKKAFNSKSAQKFFDVNKINKLLENHYSGKKDCYKKVWTIYTFLVWYKIYFE